MSTSPSETRLRTELAAIETAGQTRRRVLESPCGRIAMVDGKKVLNFASNDYLGLSCNAYIAQVAKNGISPRPADRASACKSRAPARRCRAS